MSKITIDANLYERVKKVAQAAGYASPDEFVVHMIEKELANIGSTEDSEKVTERLKGLGYIE